MALDLQTKLQQAKLKILSLNPAGGENLNAAAPGKKPSDYYELNGANDLDETDLFGKDKLISYENMFKQNVRDAAAGVNTVSHAHVSHRLDDFSSNDLNKLPGVNNLAGFKATYLTEDVAARRIQNAFRQHLMRKRQRFARPFFFYKHPVT